MRSSKKYLFGMGLLVMACRVQANEYPIGLEEVYQSALSVSNEYRALEQESRSAKALSDSENKYYLPTLSLTSEWYQYYGAETPDPEEEDTLKLNAEIKLWGSGVADKISAAGSNLEASQLLVFGESLSVYHTVLRYLAKIERTRVFLADNENIERRLKVYLEKQRNSSIEGASAMSSLKEAELEYSRFKDSVDRIRASIDQMFRSLREETNYQTDYPRDVGISVAMLEQLLAQDIASITEMNIVQSNLELRNRNLLLDYQLKTAKAQRERFTVSLVNETQFEVFGSDDWDSGETKTDSYIGFEATYDLFNYQNSQGQKSAYHLYDAESERVDLLRLQLISQLNSLQKEFLDIKDKRESLMEQILLNEDLVTTQESELLIDKLEYVDIVQSLSGLSSSYTTLLDYELSLIDAVVDTMSLRSEKFASND
ncbi:TolC family protein [Marinomonas sp. A79]|uniref:TolC family protein n=1 Tax=Marinomonas vulgaris TaxID=2823372 RepID=A0ABS5HDS8_9GAMM|nr:TolC family protein [Marinomonas vulgaris]MBR7889797.1 TolC family protein [Marinomonas vulgaris]